MLSSISIAFFAPGPWPLLPGKTCHPFHPSLEKHATARAKRMSDNGCRFFRNEIPPPSVPGKRCTPRGRTDDENKLLAVNDSCRKLLVPAKKPPGCSLCTAQSSPVSIPLIDGCNQRECTENFQMHLHMYTSEHRFYTRHKSKTHINLAFLQDRAIFH